MTETILRQCTVRGNVVMLPDEQLERNVYEQVAKALQGIGGKWNRKAGGFLFSRDPQDLLAKICEGDKINLKKDGNYIPI